MSSANPLWGSPRIVGELRMIGIDVVKSTVDRYMIRRRKPPSPTWRAFLKNHIREIVAVDFFVVPTVRNQVLFVFLVLAHERRRVLHFNVTAYPTAEWTAQQIVEAFPWENPPRFLPRDRDSIYAEAFQQQVEHMGVGVQHHAPPGGFTAARPGRARPLLPRRSRMSHPGTRTLRGRDTLRSGAGKPGRNRPDTRRHLPVGSGSAQPPA